MNYVVTSSPNAARCKCYPQQNAVTDITQLAASICGTAETFALAYYFEQIVRRGLSHVPAGGPAYQRAYRLTYGGHGDARGWRAALGE
jgi:hypothetical protein